VIHVINVINAQSTVNGEQDRKISGYSTLLTLALDSKFKTSVK